MVKLQFKSDISLNLIQIQNNTIIQFCIFLYDDLLFNSYNDLICNSWFL